MANLSKITIGAEEPRFPRQKTVSDKCVYKDIQKKEEAIPIRMTPKDTLSVYQWNWLLSIILQCGVTSSSESLHNAVFYNNNLMKCPNEQFCRKRGGFVGNFVD